MFSEFRKELQILDQEQRVQNADDTLDLENTGEKERDNQVNKNIQESGSPGFSKKSFSESNILQGINHDQINTVAREFKINQTDEGIAEDRQVLPHNTIV